MFRKVSDPVDNTLKFLGFFLLLLSAVLLIPPVGLTQAKGDSGQGNMPLPGTLMWVRVRATHVRQAPSADSPSLDILRRDQLVLGIKKGREWTKVQYDLGKSGWIFRENLSLGKPPKLRAADRVLTLQESVHGSHGNVDIVFNGAVGKGIKGFSISTPPRLVLDLSDVKVRGNRRFPWKRSSLIKEIKVGVHPNCSRLVLDLLKKTGGFTYRGKGNQLILAVSFKSLPVAKKAQRAAGTSSNGIVKKKKINPALPRSAAIQKSAKSLPSPHPTIVVFKTGFNDTSRESMIILNVSATPSYYIQFKKGKVGLILRQTRIDKRYTRFLDTSAFPTPIQRITFKNILDSKGKRRAEVWVSMEGMVPYDIVRGKRVLKWIFQKPAKYLAMEQPRVKQLSSKTSQALHTRVIPTTAHPVKKVPSPAQAEKGKGLPSPRTASSSQGTPGKKYTGKRMTFNFYKADIHDILRLIAQVSNLNIVAADNVQGKVTLFLKDVPWDQALDIILQAKGLGKERVGNVLRIAPLSDLAKEFKEKISAKKSSEELEPLKTVYIPINYTTATDLSTKVKPILSSRGTVTVDERTNTLIVKDIPKKIENVQSFVKRLDTPTPEVLIESRIVEANKDFTREIGIKWGARYNAGPQYGNAPSSNFPNSMNVRGGATGQAGNITTGGTTGGTTSGTTTATGILPNVNLPVTASYGALGVTLEQVANIFTLDAELSAMEDNGQGRVISSPRIATLDNKKAKIEQGLRIPYLKITEEGTVTTEFIEANLNMEVTPHVSNDRMINMELQVSKDTPDWAHLVQGVPSIDKKQATTNVMVKDGGVTAIGGIFTTERTSSVHKVPFFGDIPILGWAFKNKRTVRNRKELLIFISPKIIPLKGGRRN